MPKTLSRTDPNLLDAVQRHTRTQRTTGGILIAYGLITQVVGLTTTSLHPVGGLPFIAIGFFCLVWGDPALLAAAGVLFAFSIIPSAAPAITLLGPDPLVQLTGMVGLELLISIGVKAVLAFSSLQQFLLFRLLYGTESATSDEADLAIIPPMVVNRTDRLARWARSTGLIAAACGGAALGFLLLSPGALSTTIAAELSGALASVAIGLGLGAAFAPTQERPAALLGVGVGLLAYLTATFVLLQLA